MNNRNIRIGVFIFILFLVSLAADSLGFTTSINAGEGLTLTAEPGIASILSIGRSFLALVLFQVQNIPAVVSFAILVLTIWLLLDIITWIKGE